MDIYAKTLIVGVNSNRHAFYHLWCQRVTWTCFFGSSILGWDVRCAFQVDTTIMLVVDSTTRLSKRQSYVDEITRLGALPWVRSELTNPPQLYGKWALVDAFPMSHCSAASSSFKRSINFSRRKGLNSSLA